MAAPSNTVWGNIIKGSKDTRQGKIGMSSTVTTTATQLTVKIETWFWSMYSIEDVNNKYYYNADSSATSLIGSVNINHTVATGSGWSTSNQTRLGSSTYTYNRGTSATTKYFAAKLTGIDNLGSSNATSVSTSVNIPALTSYSVKYNANGGSGGPTSQTKWYGTTLKLSTIKPTRTGYSFQGWSTANDSSVEYAAGANYTANTGVTLYAVWKANTYSVKFDANGGSGAPASQTKTYGVDLTLSTSVPTRQYYNFLGWSTSKTATTATYKAGGKYTANTGTTLYAVWELAYIKPRIGELSVARCNSAGDSTTDGTYARVKFKWACDMDATSIKIEWDLTESDSYTQKTSVTITDKRSGTVDMVVGSNKLNVDVPYKFRITVTDTESSVAFGNIHGSVFGIDVLVANKGVAFGKKASIPKTAEFAWPVYATAGFRHPVLEAGKDFDTLFTPNTYILKNTNTAGYLNCPLLSGTGLLNIETCGEEGQTRQTVTICSKTNLLTYERYYYQSSWGEWLVSSASEILLFNKAKGSNGAISLPAEAQYCKYLDIYFTDNNTASKGYLRHVIGSGEVNDLFLIEASDISNTYIRRTKYNITTSAITPKLDTAAYARISGTAVGHVGGGTNYIYIYRVVGIK